MDNDGASSRMIICLNNTVVTCSTSKNETLPENGSAIIVVFGTVLDEAEPVHITNEGLALRTEQIETTDSLLKMKIPPVLLPMRSCGLP